MLSLELIAILALLFGFVLYVMAVTQFKRRARRLREPEVGERADLTGQPVSVDRRYV